MAIIIPSKNIYDIDNQKSRNNELNNISIGQSIVSKEAKYDTNVYNHSEFNLEKIPIFRETDGTDKGLGFYSLGKEGLQGKAFWGAYCGYQDYTYSNILVEIPRLTKYGYIESVKDGNKNGISDIKYQVFSKRKSGKANGVFHWDDQTLKRVDVVLNDITEESEYVEEFPKSQTYAYGATNEAFDLYGSASASATFYEPFSIKTSDITYEKDKIKIPLTVIDGATIVKLGTSTSLYGTGETISYEDEGTFDTYIPQKVELSFLGNEIGINLTDGSITYGSGNKPCSLSGNELLQDSGKVKTIDESGNEDEKPITEHLANNVLKQYERGKETATLLCSISDYYDYETNEKVIDTASKKMSFRLHDKVVPMVFGANGQDRPMSLRIDGSPKVFEVVGSKIFYDGAVWQEIILQETLDKI